MDLARYLAAEQQRVDEALQRLLPPAEGPARTVAAAMRYAVLGGGKRLRPILALAAHDACGGARDGFVDAAAALELIHTYSLVHDDLPAMDDDDLRRGRPTLHRAFGEAVAVLTGDALLTLAFELLASRPPGAEHAASRAAAVLAAAQRAGIDGMVGGQVADLEGAAGSIDEERLHWIHRHKTGALFAVAGELGAIHAGGDPARRGAFARYGEAVGLAFQITDDILDCTGSAGSLGKTPGKDERSGKATFPALFGLSASRERSAELIAEARDALAPLGLLTPPLAALAAHAVARTG